MKQVSHSNLGTWLQLALLLFFPFFFQMSGLSSISISSAWGPIQGRGVGTGVWTDKAPAQWVGLCPEAGQGYGGRTPGRRKLWAMRRQEPGTQSSEVGWLLAPQPVELLFPATRLPASPGPCQRHGPHSCPKPGVSEGCRPTHEWVSCFSHPWTLCGSSICHCWL